MRSAVKYNSFKLGISWTDKLNLFNELPRSVRFNAALQMYNGVAKNLQFFVGRDPSFIVSVVPFLTPLQCHNDELIYLEG